MPPAFVIELELLAVNVPATRPAMLMPSLALVGRVDVVEGERRAAGAGHVDRRAAGRR